MAGDWIPIRHDLDNDPTVAHVAQQLRDHFVTNVTLSVDEMALLLVVRALRRLWEIGDQQTIDGVLQGFTPGVLDAHVGLPGFTEALASANDPWILIKPNSLVIPKFDEFLSKSAKKRLLAAKRQARHRCDKSNAGSVTKVTPMAQQERDEKRDRSVVDSVTNNDNYILPTYVRADVPNEFLKIDWEQARDIANRHVTALSDAKVPIDTNRANRRLVLKACGLVQAGRLPEDWLTEAIAEVIAGGDEVRKPAALLTDRLKAGAAERGVDFAAVRKQLNVPLVVLELKKDGSK